MTVYLLDVSVLLALVDPMHVHHDIAHGWFSMTGAQAWATCPITENGLVRIISRPSYPSRPGDADVVLDILRGFCQVDGHTFWLDDVSIRELIDPEHVFTHAQIADLFLLGLAVRHRGKLATLDRRIPATVVPGGPEALEVISG